MLRPEKRKLERVQYWQGQMLRSCDFQDIETGEAQRRWWHNRALHNAYGVAAGLRCSLESGSPDSVLISPGVAYDVFGREMVLEKSQIIPVPNSEKSGMSSLLMRYHPPTPALRPHEVFENCWTACGSIGTAGFVWKPGDRLNPADGVVVCTVEHSKRKVRIPKLQLRFVARPQARPLLASGTTIPGNTPWSEWKAEVNRRGQIIDFLGVQTWIDTSAAGFVQVPCYFAWLEGPLWNPQAGQLAPAIFPSITDETVNGFTFRLLSPATSVEGEGNEAVLVAAMAAKASDISFVVGPRKFTLFARQQGLYVSWMGCQMQAAVSCCGQQEDAAVAAP